MVRIDAGLFRSKLADMAGIETLSYYLKIHSSDQRFLVVRVMMKAILHKLAAIDFIRVHRGCRQARALDSQDGNDPTEPGMIVVNHLP